MAVGGGGEKKKKERAANCSAAGSRGKKGKGDQERKKEGGGLARGEGKEKVIFFSYSGKRRDWKGGGKTTDEGLILLGKKKAKIKLARHAIQSKKGRRENVCLRPVRIWAEEKGKKERIFIRS